MMARRKAAGVKTRSISFSVSASVNSDEGRVEALGAVGGFV